MRRLSLLLLTTLRIRAGAAATFDSSSPWLPPRAVGFLSPPTARRQQQLGSVDWTTRHRSSSSSSSRWNVLSSEVVVVVPPFFPSLQRGDRSRGGVSSLLIASSTASASSSAAEAADTAQQQQPTDGRRGSRGGSNRRRQQKRRRNNNGRRNNGQRRNNNNNNYYTDARSLERRITTLGRTGKTSQALELYNSLWSSTSNIVPTVRLMNGAIDACARARPTRLETAFELFQEGVERGLEPNVFTFGSLMSVCARGRDAERALKLLKSMQDEYNICPNAVVYSTAISACERSVPPRSQMALKLLRESTQDPNVQMSVVGYNAAISALARAGEWELAVQLLDEMESGTTGDDGECSSSEGNNSTNGETVEAPAIGANDDEDVQTGKRTNTLLNPNVIPPQPDGVTYGTVMAACERSEKWHEVLRFANAMLNHENLGKGIVMDGMALTSALHACQRLGLADEAMEYLTMMKRLGGINGVANNGQTDDRNGNGLNGRQTGGSFNQRQTQGRNRPFAKKPLRGPDSVAYRLAISACARSPNGERWHDGIRLLTEMRNVTGSAPDVVAYTAAISGCAAAGEWRYAFQLLDEMRNEGVEPNVITYSVVIDACATASSLAAGTRKSKDETDDEESDKPTSDVKVKVTGAIRKPMQKALKLLNVLNNDPTLVEPNVITYNAAIRACAEGLDLKKAFRLMEELKERNLRPTLVTYGSLMTACERVGNVDGASKVFRMMKEQQKEEEEDKDDVEVEVEEMIQPNEIIYGAAISCCRKAGEPERALLLLKKMIKDNLSPNTATFNTVLMAQTEDKQSISKGLDRAMLVYKLMKSTKYAPNKSQRPNRQTYTILIRSLSQNKRPADAELLLRKMSLEDQLIPDVDLYTSTVTSYERCGQPLRAVQLMESMNRDGYDFYEVKVLNAAFKKAVRLVNAVVSSSPKSSGGGSSSTLGGEPVLEEEDDEVEGGVDVVASLDDGEEDMFVNGR